MSQAVTRIERGVSASCSFGGSLTTRCLLEKLVSRRVWKREEHRESERELKEKFLEVT